MTDRPTTTTDRNRPTGTDRPGDSGWGVLGTRIADWSARTTDKVLQVVSDHQADPQADPRPAGADRADRLRYIPPAAALGTAFVLQVIVVTDTLGSALADRYAPTGDRAWLWFVVAGLFGLAVASGIEGSAAYLMDLYDKHLLARDSVWLLRLAMLAYVAASAGLIHWWTTARDLPQILSWMLAAMAGSALFLWTRGSRWRHREALRAAGHLDPAMPRLPMPAKVLHPIRWLITLYLVSWDPAGSPAEARARYDQWRDERRQRRTDRPTNRPDTDRPKAEHRTARPTKTTDRPRRPAPPRPPTDRQSVPDIPSAVDRDAKVLERLRKLRADLGRMPTLAEIKPIAGGARAGSKCSPDRALRFRRLLDADTKTGDGNAAAK